MLEMINGLIKISYSSTIEIYLSKYGPIEIKNWEWSEGNCCFYSSFLLKSTADIILFWMHFPLSLIIDR